MTERKRKKGRERKRERKKGREICRERDIEADRERETCVCVGGGGVVFREHSVNQEKKKDGKGVKDGMVRETRGRARYLD